MRRFTLLCALLSALAAASTASAAPRLPESGLIVYEDHRTYAVVEVRDKTTGRVVSEQLDMGEKGGTSSACGDSHHTFFGPRWHAFEPYVVNVASTPSYLSGAAALADLVGAHAAWESPFLTDCPFVPGSSPYDAMYAGTTRLQPTLVTQLVSDGANTAAFASLAGTICDGGIACVVVDYDGSKINEADLAIEQNLARYGLPDLWTTDDTTWFTKTDGRISLSDIATHEWGHFAGLGHANRSPALTMYPYIHDGAQTLGLGDMKGAAARYQ